MHPVVWVAVYTVCNFGGRLGCSRRVGDAEGLLESCEGTCTDQARRGWQNAFQVLKVGGKLPRLNKEWKMLKGRHDGGTGDGLPLGRVAFQRIVGKVPLHVLVARKNIICGMSFDESP